MADGARPGPGDVARRGAAGRESSFGRSDPVARLERQVLEVVLQMPGEALAAGFDDVAADAFSVPAHRAVHDAIRAVGGVGAYGTEATRRAADSRTREDAATSAAALWAESVREAAAGPVAAAVTELAVAPLPEDRPASVAAYARGVLTAFLEMGITRRIAEVRGRLQRADPADPDYGAIFAELVHLEERRRALRTDS